MTTIKPFKAVRPDIQFAKDVAALPYDVMNSDEARLLTKNQPYSFLHIDKAEIDLALETDPYSDAVYQRAKETYENMKKNKIFIQDKNPCLYIYRLTMVSHSQTGLVASTSIDEYIDNTIKKHELTRADKEEDRIRHVDTLNANTGPIFLAYTGKDEINNIINSYKNENSPIYDFTSEDGIGHTVWIIENNEIITRLSNLFKEIPNLYIADGHHRNASALKVGLKRRREFPNYNKEDEFNFYLSVLFPSSELKIMDYNRVVKDLNGYSSEEFIKELENRGKFIIKLSDIKGPFKPQKPHQFGLYINNKWYSLEAKKEIIKDDPVLGLDVSILQKEILEPLLNIGDPRTDKRIDFIGGIRGLVELEKKVDSGEMALAFSMYPTSMEELMNVANADLTMPPKSTWFEPKLRSGLFIHELS